MQSTIYFVLAFVAFTAAKQLNSGPPTLTETSSSSKSNDKRYATQEYTLYLTPSELKALQEANAANKEEQTQGQEQQYTLQSYSQPEISEWSKYNGQSAEQPQAEKQEISQNPEWLLQKPVFENQEGDFDFYNYYRDQKAAEEQARKLQSDNGKKESEWIPFNPASSKTQEESLLHEQLQQHWNRILEHNRGQLKALSSGNENKNSEETKENNENKDSTYQWQSIGRNQEEEKNEFEREIEYALKHQQAFEKEGSGEGQSNSQRTPILIHKEVRVTKHLPVHVVKKVKVAVPTPVLVPVPEPYEVKVPHPYPVPREIIKQIPVPVIRHY